MTGLGVAGVLVSLAGCGGGWSAADTKSATNALKVELLIEALCSGDAGCVASRVRALDRVAICDNESQLARHGSPVDLDGGGFHCRP